MKRCWKLNIESSRNFAYFVSSIIAMDTNLSLQVKEGYYALYKYIHILTDTQINRLSHIAMGMLQVTDFTDEEIFELEQKIAQPVNHSD
jgi:hypothetical protein